MILSNKTLDQLPVGSGDLIYLAGPMGDDSLLRSGRAHHASRIATELLMLGLTPFVPQLSHFWNESTPLPRELWLRYDMAIIERCQLVLRLPGKSEGAEVEERCAKQLGIPWIVAEHEPLAYVHTFSIWKSADEKILGSSGVITSANDPATELVAYYP